VGTLAHHHHVIVVSSSSCSLARTFFRRSESVSLIGRCVHQDFFGFSINSLTMFGITLATGLS